MPEKRYAVVSCHVERLCDDRVWARYASLLEARRESRIVSLVRPPDREAGEDEAIWLQRARRLVGLGPLGQHTHWTSPTHARPSDERGTGERVRREAAWLRNKGFAPSVFVGGGWYTDASVADACAELGYVDCTPRASRPHYLGEDDAWAELATPARIDLSVGKELLAVPTTHSVGDTLRAGVRPRALGRGPVHVYFHDTDLLDRRRQRVVVMALHLLALRCQLVDLSAVAPSWAVERVPWKAVARGGAAGPPQ